MKPIQFDPWKLLVVSLVIACLLPVAALGLGLVIGLAKYSQSKTVEVVVHRADASATPSASPTP